MLAPQMPARGNIKVWSERAVTHSADAALEVSCVDAAGRHRGSLAPIGDVLRLWLLRLLPATLSAPIFHVVLQRLALLCCLVRRLPLFFAATADLGAALARVSMPVYLFFLFVLLVFVFFASRDYCYHYSHYSCVGGRPGGSSQLP